MYAYIKQIKQSLEILTSRLIYFVVVVVIIICIVVVIISSNQSLSVSLAIFAASGKCFGYIIFSDI